MAWRLSTLHKESVTEMQYWYKDHKAAIRYQGYHWGTFWCECDPKPEVDLENPDGYELWNTDWKLESLDEEYWADWGWFHEITLEDEAEIEAAWEEDGMSQAGWLNDNTDYFLKGPLQLKNVDTGEVWQGLSNDSI